MFCELRMQAAREMFPANIEFRNISAEQHRPYPASRDSSLKRPMKKKNITFWINGKDVMMARSGAFL
jgi:hypothetical protein